MLEPDKNTGKNKKKGPLGRGVGSLFGDIVDEEPAVEPVVQEKVEIKATPVPAPEPTPVQEAVPEEMRIWNVAIDKVEPNKDQPRKEFDGEKIQELAQSIREQGIIQPITVRKLEGKGYQIIAGERRWRAAQHAGLHEVPVIIKEADNKKVKEWALIENIQRENLNPLEEAEAYNQLLQDAGYTHQQLAERVGKERATISNSLRILTLPREVREFVRDKKLSSGHAKALSGLTNPEQLKILAKTAVKKSLSVRAIEKEVAAIKKGVSGQNETPETPSSRQAENLAKELQQSLGTRVKIDYQNGGKGRLTVHFYSDEELTNLSNKLKSSL